MSNKRSKLFLKFPRLYRKKERLLILSGPKYSSQILYIYIHIYCISEPYPAHKRSKQYFLLILSHQCGVSVLILLLLETIKLMLCGFLSSLIDYKEYNFLFHSHSLVERMKTVQRPWFRLLSQKHFSCYAFFFFSECVDCCCLPIRLIVYASLNFCERNKGSCLKTGQHSIFVI